MAFPAFSPLSIDFHQTSLTFNRFLIMFLSENSRLPGRAAGAPGRRPWQYLGLDSGQRGAPMSSYLDSENASQICIPRIRILSCYIREFWLGGHMSCTYRTLFFADSPIRRQDLGGPRGRSGQIKTPISTTPNFGGFWRPYPTTRTSAPTLPSRAHPKDDVR